MSSSTSSPNTRRYVVCLLYNDKAEAWPFRKQEEADVADLWQDIRAHPSYEDALKHSTLTLYKVGVQPDNLDIEPSEKLRERAWDWLRKDPPRNPMQPARRLSKYFPEGPTPEDKDMIDIIALAESTGIPAKRSRPSEEESPQALQRQRQRQLQERPVLFPTETGAYFHTDPGAFGWQLEHVDDWWNFYVFWTNQSSDIEVQQSVVALATNKQGLDDPNHRLSELTETCGCLYVLPFYRRLAERIFIFRREDQEKGIVLTGQPGTGVYCYLLYGLVLIKTREDNLAVVHAHTLPHKA
ncbi:uncharacterized protein FOMMEDRAFT_163111 [Fomitiporia mediterranea MF3/22]|uniref:Uncharacterized protein n=1 Tax=Fomitiporia mediterranea (strain MF3/22) TaxID=694068 RepID=R7SIQ2_FOMME|nr:uncharacterized protein FOMMEDRAFT_163111 [Fomitiporia mediterranea MF3/22]EJC97489.1 hypothetical protein FOMMEDRAFT_163111 [Fomitiporia mediterranea MF3/22]